MYDSSNDSILQDSANWGNHLMVGITNRLCVIFEQVNFFLGVCMKSNIAFFFSNLSVAVSVIPYDIFVDTNNLSNHCKICLESKTDCCHLWPGDFLLWMRVNSNSPFSFPTSVWLLTWFFRTSLLMTIYFEQTLQEFCQNHRQTVVIFDQVTSSWECT